MRYNNPICDWSIAVVKRYTDKQREKPLRKASSLLTVFLDIERFGGPDEITRGAGFVPPAVVCPLLVNCDAEAACAISAHSWSTKVERRHSIQLGEKPTILRGSDL